MAAADAAQGTGDSMTPPQMPPYRADQVGSLLRPKVLADARRGFKD